MYCYQLKLIARESVGLIQRARSLSASSHHQMSEESPLLVQGQVCVRYCLSGRVASITNQAQRANFRSEFSGATMLNLFFLVLNCFLTLGDGFWLECRPIPVQWWRSHNSNLERKEEITFQQQVSIGPVLVHDLVSERPSCNLSSLSNGVMASGT